MRKHLDLPHDALNALFHARIPDGGLGVPSLRLIVPKLRIRRLEDVRMCLSSLALSGFINDFLHLHIKRAVDCSLPGDPDLYWRSRFSSSFDGTGFIDSHKTPGQHNWIRGADLFLSGRDFINSVKLCFNALPCRSRCSRGRTLDRLCRAGCAMSENLGHILQVCPRTYGQRVKRHDAVLNYAVRGLEQRGFQVVHKPHFSTSEGLRKPDIIAIHANQAFVIDAQVVSDGEPLRKAHNRKVDKYQALRPMIVSQFNVDSVNLHSLTLNWRGVWSPDSCALLLEDGLIRKADVPVISSRVLIGGLAGFNFFSKSTQPTRSIFRHRRQ